MRVIGTAGHVDHGKSTLVRALTGIDPDRLQEEKKREMTIDLGFAWMSLPPVAGHATTAGPLTVGVVDVPGHIDFIKNMLAGVGGIDAALLVIAADEGVMPQTREHLAILDLLAVPGLLVALTKVDAAPDEEWLDLVELDIAELLETTCYGGSTVQRVSAVDGTGLDQLRGHLSRLLADLSPRRDRGLPRLPIDRVFSLSGFGTIVTGTLQDGYFATGDAVTILPANRAARIRGIQSHHTNVDEATPGSRVALNLTGVATDDLHRGDVVVKPGSLEPTHLIDVGFRLLSSAPQALRHNQLVEFYCGASEVLAHVRLLGKEQLAPGEEGWLQLRLAQPVVVAQGDRYILRRPSPSETLGGGSVLNPHPRRRWRRFDVAVLDRLAVLAKGDPGEVLLQTLMRAPFCTADQLIAASGLDQSIAQAQIETLQASGALVTLGSGESAALLTAESWRGVTDLLAELLTSYHASHPLRQGMPRGEARSRLAELMHQDGLDLRRFNALVAAAEASGLIAADEGTLRLASFSAGLSPQQEARTQAALDRLAAAGVDAPPLHEVMQWLGGDETLFDFLVESGALTRVGTGLAYRTADFERCVDDVRGYIAQHGQITLAEARDLWQTSRKYAQALLEEMDARRITRREGDARRLRR